MPANPKKRKSAAADDDDDIPVTKRGKAASGTAFQPSTKSRRDSDGNEYWEIAKARRVTISHFKGKTLVNIREYYEKDGQWLPGKKGISMSVEQYTALIQIMPQIEECLLANSEPVPRPNYHAALAGHHGNDDDDDDDEEPDAKHNIDATSDEDDD